MNKVERQLSLLLYLLDSPHGRTRSEIIAGLDHTYGDGKAESIRRKFERDKDSLKELGIPLGTRPHDDGQRTVYTVDRSALFLDLPHLSLEEEEALRQAFVHHLGEQPQDIAYLRLFRKIFGDEDLNDIIGENPELARQVHDLYQIDEAGAATGDIQSKLGSAIQKKHAVTFRYALFTHSQIAAQIGPGAKASVSAQAVGPTGDADKTESNDRLHSPPWSFKDDRLRTLLLDFGQEPPQRTVEPYGMILNEHRWCLVGRQIDPQPMGERFFYIDRILDLETDSSHKFTLPTNFRLTDYRLHPLRRSVHPRLKVSLTFNDLSPASKRALAGYLQPGDDSAQIKEDGKKFLATVSTTHTEALYNFLFGRGLSPTKIAPQKCSLEFQNYISRLQSAFAGWPATQD